MLDTDRLNNQTRSGNAGGSSSESDTAQGCDPDDVDALELFCKPPSYYYEDGYIKGHQLYRVGQINWDQIHFSITDLFMGGFGSNFVRISIK